MINENNKLIRDGKDQSGRTRTVILDNVGGPTSSFPVVMFSEAFPGQGKVTWLSPNGNSSTTYDIRVAKRVVELHEEWLESLSETSE